MFENVRVLGWTVYLPPKFAMSDADVAAALGRAGFAQLVTQGPDGLLVTPLPLLYDAGRHALLGHVARANPHWHAAACPSVAIFTGPQAYISPGFYATKAETGRVVPTWNYEVLNAYGPLTVHDDAAWLRDLVGRLTDHHEANRPEPWRVTDAPEAFVNGQLNAIVGIEIVIERVEAKAKMSQNQPARNREGVVAGLSHGTAIEHAVAQRVTELEPNG